MQNISNYMGSKLFLIFNQTYDVGKECLSEMVLLGTYAQKNRLISTFPLEYMVQQLYKNTITIL